MFFIPPQRAPAEEKAIARAVQSFPMARGARSAMFTVLYDNEEHDRRLIPAHGFACLVEVGGARLLFDTGGDPAVLFYNMGVLGVHPRSISAVVISHNHWDHVGGLSALLSRNPSVAVAAPGSSRSPAEGVYVVGPLEVEYKGTPIREQALAVETAKGVVLVVGCSHPGVERLVEEALRLLPGRSVAAVIGGLHLVESDEKKALATARRLRELGVEKLVACHCTGKRALEALSRVHGGVLPCGVGASYTFG